MKINQIESLRIVKAVVENGNFSRAAEYLDLTPAWVAKAIERLESELNATLFRRTTRQVSTTEAGQLCYKQACEILERWEDLRFAMDQTQSDLRGTIKLSMPMSFGISVMAKLLGQFQQQNPQVELDIELSDEEVRLGEQEFDVVIRLTFTLPDSSLLVKTLRSYRMVTCATPAYLQAHGMPQTPADLAGHKILKFERQVGVTRWAYLVDGEWVTIELSPYVKANNSELLHTLLCQDQGIARIPEFIVAKDLAEGRLVELLTDFPSPELSLHLLRPNNKRITARVQAFYAFMQAQLGREE